MGSNNEPSNPFKNRKKSPSDSDSRSTKTNQRSSTRSTSPPAPPGRTKKAPPVAPSSVKSTSKKTAAAAPARAPARGSKSVGLRKKSAKAKTDAQKKTDERARELIAASRTKVAASQAARTDSKPAKTEPSNPFKKTQGQKSSGRPAPQRRGGRFNKRNKPQGPAKRTLKLHRGKYMEFKYDVRKILDEEKVEDEYRSNVLGQTWAKGERQGVSDAKEFLEGKVADGIISENCSKRIIKLIDSLTTRR